MFHRLAGMLVAGEVILLVVMRGSGTVGMRGHFVEFGSSLMRIVVHDGSFLGWLLSSEISCNVSALWFRCPSPRGCVTSRPRGTLVGGGGRIGHGECAARLCPSAGLVNRIPTGCRNSAHF